jgi:hypothetical protein
MMKNTKHTKEIEYFQIVHQYPFQVHQLQYQNQHHGYQIYEYNIVYNINHHHVLPLLSFLMIFCKDLILLIEIKKKNMTYLCFYHIENIFYATFSQQLELIQHEKLRDHNEDNEDFLDFYMTSSITNQYDIYNPIFFSYLNCLCYQISKEKSTETILTSRYIYIVLSDICV